jgi:ribosome-binding protein aMBF1 (putative translation factor)
VGWSLGGTKTVPLCEICHSKIHGKDLRISSLTKAALQAAKARGVKLGNPQNLTETARINSAISRRKQAREHNRQAVEIAILLRDRGWSMREIAERLNALGFRTRRGKFFYVSAVDRLLNVYNA